MKPDLTRFWYLPSLHFIFLPLLPVSWLFGLVTAVRRRLYRSGWLRAIRFNVPVIVVGNITVGGTGKTPFVISLAETLKSLGYRPGIVSRGVGGKRRIKPRRVSQDDTPDEVGDEAVLIVRRTGCPMVTGIDRVAAVRELLRHSQCDVVISDDGLQHYRLARDMEIVLVDGARHFGNRHLLPAGPLREPESRLRSADFVVINGESPDEDGYTMKVEPTGFISIQDSNVSVSMDAFPRESIHAVAGIGHPERFFSLLSAAGFNLIRHVFPDHHLYQASDLKFNDNRMVVMTEKDAVKCSTFAGKHYWYLSIKVKISDKLIQAVMSKLDYLEKGDDEKDFASPVCAASCSHLHDGNSR